MPRLNQKRNGQPTPAEMLACYERLGWSLTPCDGKKPLNKGWGDDCLATEAVEIHLHDGGSVAVVLGPSSGVVDLECDNPQADEDLTKLFDGAVPKTPTWRSRRGLHHLFAWDDRLESVGRAKVSLGHVDALLGANGRAACSILPPSVVDGVRRRWLPGLSPLDVEPAKLPENIVEKLRVSVNAPKCESKGGDIPEGKRNKELFKIGALARDQGLDAGVVGALLVAVNEHRCKPPLPDPEVEQVVKSVIQYDNKKVSKVSGLDPWGDPVLVDDPGEVPAFPVESLPAATGEWAAAVAENSQTPVDLAAMLSLSALAVAVAKKAVIQPYDQNPDYTEPANLWTCTPLPPANRKTFVVNMARRPFDAFLSAWRKEHGREHAIKCQERAALEKRRGQLTDRLAKAEDDEDYRETKAELETCIDQLGEIDTYVPRFFADDVTPERLVVLMSQHGGRISILSDEGGCFDHFAGLYNKRPNIDVYMHSHSGGTIYRDRQTDGEEVCVEQAALTLGLSPQPQVIEQMTSKDRLQGRGILARFLWSFPKSTLGVRDWTPQPIPNGAKVPYAQTILALLAWSPESPLRVKLSAGAFRLWIEAARGFELQLAEGGALSSPGIQEWAGKLPGAIARVALLLHMTLSGKQKLVVGPETMARAIAIGEYLVPHARAAFKILRTDPATDAARVLQQWIINRAAEGESTFTKSQAQQNHKSRFPNVSDMDKPLQILVDRQVCRPTRSETKGPGRPSAWYEINPALAPKP